MNCPSCQTGNAEHAQHCVRCGTALGAGELADTFMGGGPASAETSAAGSGVHTSAGVLSPIPTPSSRSKSARGSPADQTLVGTDFGTRYRVDSQLGQGGMGRVYKAYDKELNRNVAIKVLRAEFTAEPEAMERFKQELLLASKISHKNILRIHDLGDVDGVKFISMAFVEGCDLHQLLQKEGRLPADRIAAIGEQLCRALEAARVEGVVHRDLKPQNILVDQTGQIYVSDFGLAKSFESNATGMTRTGAFLGTPQYMSPEQIEGKPANHRSDLYAVGLILYEMGTGAMPFKGDSALEIMFQHVKQTPTNPKSLNPNLPEYLVAIILKCLEKDPAQRYETAGAILADLEARHAPQQRERANTVSISLPLPGKKGWILGGLAAIALIAIALAIPGVRHLFWRAGSKTASTTGNTIPSLAEGKFLAVMPFKVIGDQNTLGYIADGLAEGLSSKLFQLKDVRLASAASVEKAGRKDSMEKIARDLGVNLVVNGMVQSGGDKIRIIVNLEDVAGGRRLWSKDFSGVPADLLTLEDQIYAGMVEALKIKPSQEEMARAGAHPTEKVDAYDLYLRGRNAMRSQQDVKSLNTAIDFFDQAKQNDPAFALAYSGIADASMLMYHQNKDSFWSQKALAAAQQAQALNPNLPEVHFTLGNVYRMTGKNAESISELKRALQLAPNSDEAYRGLGSAYLADGRPGEAIQAYQSAVKINPYFWVNYNVIGQAYFQLGQYDKALEAFKRIPELEPDNAFGYVNIASVYTQQGKYQEALAPFQKALELHPHFTAYSNLGTTYFYLKRYPESVTMFEKAVEMNPQEEVTMGNLGDAYRWSGQSAKADATYDKAISLCYSELRVNPRSAATMGNLGNYYAKKKDVAKAQDFMKRALAIDPNDVDILYTSALVQVLGNHPSEAIGALRTAFQKGYPAALCRNDPEFESLHKLPAFQELMKEFSKAN
jgi:serine/threonine-protein kinase